MKVKLFIPCYIDQFYPNVGIAAYQLLIKLGCEVDFPLHQTCCGQPMANSGFHHLTQKCNNNFIEQFNGEEPIVCPSGSCTLHIKEHLFSEQKNKEADTVRNNVYELTEFITDILKTKPASMQFKHRVGFHTSCHGQRGLHLSSMTELMQPAFSKPEQLLQSIKGIEIFYPEKKDECCGFGGTFCVTEEAVSVKMGKDRLEEHLKNGVEIITGYDTSCLLHLEGIIKRNQYPLRVMHIAEILNQSMQP